MSRLLLCALMMCGLSARASSLTVTSLADSGAGTLRDQVAAAAPGDTIDFGVTGTIQLSGSAAILISTNLTIAGPGAASLTVNGAVGYAVGIFEISGGIVSISGLKLSNGKGNFGGAINISGGTVTLMSSTLSGNSGTDGGAIYLGDGSLVITNSTISNNNLGAYGYGGGIYVRNGSLVVASSTISGNTAGLGAGLLVTGGTVDIVNSTISGNTAKHYWVEVRPGVYNSENGKGGGIFSPGGAVTVRNSTISGNVAEDTGGSTIQRGGGGILNETTLTVANSTVTGNSAEVGGGINTIGGTLQLSNSILASNPSGGDLKGTYSTISGNYNLVEDGDTITGTNNITGQPALLGPLANNGGPTLTHALLAGSPALDAGDPNFDATNTPYDQRGVGFPRIKNGRLCIGAFESELGTFIVNTLADHDDGFPGVIDCTLREAIKYAPAGTTITFGVAGTIALTQGEIIITTNLTIAGPASAPGITVSGNSLSRIFTINSTVALSNLTLSGGNGVGATNSGSGGAINIGQGFALTVANCTFSSNSATGSGSIGGAIRNPALGTLTVMNSTFSGNSSPGVGGAIRSGGNLTVWNSTFFGNSSSNSGGAISMGGGTLTFSNNIVAGNTAPTGPDISGTVASGDYNLVQNTAGATLPGNHNVTGQPASLGPLAHNGGPTMTHALLAGSPAIDKGDATLTEDQRGVSRPQGIADDIGAFEWQPHHPTLSIGLISPSQVEICWDTVTNTGYQLQYRSTLTMNQWSPLSAWIGGTDQTICTNDSIVLNGPQRFYRVGVTNAP